MEEIKKALDTLKSDVNSFIAETNETVKEQGKLTTSQKSEMSELNEKSEEFAARLLELEQKGFEKNDPEPVLSAGDQFVKSDSFGAFKNGSTQKASFEVKNTVVGSDVTVAPDRQAFILPGATRNLTISAVLPQGNTTSNAIEYTRENVLTNNAAEAAENTAKPESGITFTLETVGVKTIAHWIKLSKQVMDDAPQLASYINTRMAYGVNHRADSQLLNGNGTGANISGLLNSGNYTVFTPTASVTAVDNIRKAMTAVRQADYAPTAVILNPGDVEAIDLLKDTNGAFVASDPRLQAGPQIWGLPIVISNAIPANSFLVGAFDMAAQVWNRQGTVVELFEQDDTNAQSNLVTLRAEKRCALTVYKPASLVGGTLTA